MVARRGHAWLLGGVCGCWGACVVARGACVARGHAWQKGVHAWQGGCAWQIGVGGMHDKRAAYMAKGGMCGEGGSMHGKGGHAWQKGGHAWDTTRYGDTINERPVCILLECILVQIAKWIKYFLSGHNQ